MLSMSSFPQRHRFAVFAAIAEGLSIFADEYGTERRDTNNTGKCDGPLGGIHRAGPLAENADGRYRDSARVRGYCRECGRYGNCWACPPYDFDETALLEQYTTISLLATVITPSEGVTLTPETADRIIRRERQRLDRMLVKMECDASVPAHTARAFFARTCLLCPPEHCTRRDSLPCRHPESIRPSLEALGFDVARTTSGLFGIDLQWGRPDAPPACLTLLSALACSRQQHTCV